MRSIAILFFSLLWVAVPTTTTLFAQVRMEVQGDIRFPQSSVLTDGGSSLEFGNTGIGGNDESTDISANISGAGEFNVAFNNNAALTLSSNRMTLSDNMYVSVGCASTFNARTSINSVGEWQLRLSNGGPGGSFWYVGGSNDNWSTGGGKFLISPAFSATQAPLTILPTGSVGIGNTSPSTVALLHVGTEQGALIRVGSLESISDGGLTRMACNSNFIPEITGIRSLGSSDIYWLNLYYNGSLVKVSDRRVKTNINDLERGLETILALRPVSYHYTTHSKDKLEPGLIAQEVEEVIPEIVYNPEKETFLDEEGQPTPMPEGALMGIDYTKLIPVLVKGMQEQQQEMETLRSLNADLQAANALLETRLSKLEALSQQSTAQTLPTSDKTTARLEQNQPNPFDTETIIYYHLPSNVQSAFLQITDQHGKVVKKYVLQGSGTGNITIQGGQLAAGTFFYTLVVNDTIIDTKKMVLTK